MKLTTFFLAFITLLTPVLAQGQESPATQVTDPEINTDKDRLVRYILDHPELENQQDLLEILLSSDSTTKTVFDLMPEKNKKEFQK